MTSLPVLGLFRDETALRDHIKDNLEALEPGLTGTSTEYPLPNASGAGGRIDILAFDPLGHVVVIEVKRSDQSARAALNELAKYVSLLVRDARVPREIIRCVVLSTDWNELALPLAFFASTSGVHVEGFSITRDGDGLAYSPVELAPLSDLPQFSPEFSLYQYESAADRERHLASIASRAASAPFARVAVVLLDPASPQQAPIWRSVACMWRLRPEDEDAVTTITGEPVGHLEPYGYPGWEAECDLLFWIADEVRPGVFFSSADEERGTPEKIRNLLGRYRTAGVRRHGDWPKVDLINTDARILEQLEAAASLISVERRNRYRFEQVASPRFGPSWRRTVREFLTFIRFEPIWAQAAQEFLDGLKDPRATVRFFVFDKNHFFYALHQALEHPGADLSHFMIQVDIDDQPVRGLSGHWAWDGKTFGKEPKAAICKHFDTLIWAQMARFNAIDTTRYDGALYDHGFTPVVMEMILDGRKEWVAEAVVGDLASGHSLQDFVAANLGYVEAVSKIFEQIPTAPPAAIRRDEV